MRYLSFGLLIGMYLLHCHVIQFYLLCKWHYVKKKVRQSLLSVRITLYALTELRTHLLLMNRFTFSEFHKLSLCCAKLKLKPKLVMSFVCYKLEQVFEKTPWICCVKRKPSEAKLVSNSLNRNWNHPFKLARSQPTNPKWLTPFCASVIKQFFFLVFLPVLVCSLPVLFCFFLCCYKCFKTFEPLFVLLYDRQTMI